MARSILLLYCLLVLSGIGQAQDATQTQFLQELKALSEKHNLQFITILTQDQPQPQPSLRQPPPTTSWIDEADLFAIRWKVTYKVQDGYLLIGPQYSLGKSNSVLYPKKLEIATGFLQSLTPVQLQSLQHEEGGSKTLDLSILEPGQREQLNQVISRIGSKKLVITPEDKGRLWFLLTSSAAIYSNGKHVGWLDAGKAEAILNYENSEDDIDPAVKRVETSQTLPKAEKEVIKINFGTVSVTDFIRYTIARQSSQAKIKMEEEIENSKYNVYVSSKDIPLNIGLNFIRESLDYEIRELGSVRYIAQRGSLLREELENQNALLAQRTLPRITHVLEALKANEPLLSQGIPEIRQSPRSHFRIELSSQTRDRVKEMHPHASLVMSQYPKVAIGGHWSILNLVWVHEGKEIRKTSIALADVLSSKPLEALAFTSLTSAPVDLP